MHMTSPIQNILIYEGHGQSLQGPYGSSVDKHVSMFEKINEKKEYTWTITKISGHEIPSQLAENPSKETLLVIPAGESSSLDKAFSEKEIDAIKTYVKKGLRLYATCGSVYWLAQQRVWGDKCSIQPNDTQLTRKEGRVGIFPGSVEGPLSFYPGQTYSTAFFHTSIRIETPERTIRVLLSGGGSFFSAEEGEDQLQVLARYHTDDLQRLNKDATWEKAVITYSYGQGKALLSMIHPGYGSEDIDVAAYKRAFPDREDDWQTIQDSLSSEEERLDFVAEWIKHLEYP